MEVEVRLVHRLERGDQDREIFRQAAGHDRVDRGGVDGELQAGGGMGGDHGLGRAALEGQRGVDAFDDRRDDGKAVGPALLVAVVDGGEQIVRDLVDAGCGSGHAGSNCRVTGSLGPSKSRRK